VRNFKEDVRVVRERRNGEKKPTENFDLVTSKSEINKGSIAGHKIKFDQWTVSNI
jgi:hypothetical protein